MSSFATIVMKTYAISISSLCTRPLASSLVEISLYESLIINYWSCLSQVLHVQGQPCWFLTPFSVDFGTSSGSRSTVWGTRLMASSSCIDWSDHPRGPSARRVKRWSLERRGRQSQGSSSAESHASYRASCALRSFSDPSSVELCTHMVQLSGDCLCFLWVFRTDGSRGSKTEEYSPVSHCKSNYHASEISSTHSRFPSFLVGLMRLSTRLWHPLVAGCQTGAWNSYSSSSVTFTAQYCS